MWTATKVYGLEQAFTLAWADCFVQFGTDQNKQGGARAVYNFSGTIREKMKEIKSAWPGLHYEIVDGKRGRRGGLCLLPTSSPSVSPVALIPASAPTPAIAEPAKAIAPPAIVASIPLEDGTEHHVTAGRLSTWESTYPDVDVRQELQRIRAWNLRNEPKRKTEASIDLHITGWLARQQRQGKAVPAPSRRRPDSDPSAALPAQEGQQTPHKAVVGWDGSDAQKSAVQAAKWIRKERARRQALK